MGQVVANENFKQVSNGAGAYHPSRVVGKRWGWGSFFLVILMFYLVWTYIFTRFGLYVTVPLSLIVGTTLFFMMFDNYIVRKVLTAPDTETCLNLSHKDWYTFHYEGWGGDSLPAHLLQAKNPSDVLILFLHGWSSAPGNNE